MIIWGGGGVMLHATLFVDEKSGSPLSLYDSCLVNFCGGEGGGQKDSHVQCIQCIQFFDKLVLSVFVYMYFNIGKNQPTHEIYILSINI